MIAYSKRLSRFVSKDEIVRVHKYVSSIYNVIEFPKALTLSKVKYFVEAHQPSADYTFITEDELVFLQQLQELKVLGHGTGLVTEGAANTGVFTEQGYKEFEAEYLGLPIPIEEYPSSSEFGEIPAAPSYNPAFNEDERIQQFIEFALQGSVQKAMDEYLMRKDIVSERGMRIVDIIQREANANANLVTKLSREGHRACLAIVLPDLNYDEAFPQDQPELDEVQRTDSNTQSTALPEYRPNVDSETISPVGVPKDLVVMMEDFLQCATTKSIQEALSLHWMREFLNVKRFEPILQVVGSDIKKAENSEKSIKLHHARYAKCMKMLNLCM